MSKRQTKGFLKKKRQATIRLVVSIIVAVYLLLNGQFLGLITFGVLLFVLNELFLADHNFYDPVGDYKYTFDKAEAVSPDWLNEGVSFKCAWAKGKYDTALLGMNIRHSLLGKCLDPFVTISSGGVTRQQYVERSVDGLRYINISEFIDSDEAISFESTFCELMKEPSKVFLFTNSTLKNKKVLVIAPHADDAEIAAFGLYSMNNSAIVTITAGEVGSKEYESKYTNKQQASLLKGRLRAWDSMAVPQWAGLKSDATIQLGYFCLGLKEMHDSPEKSVVSKASGVNDTRVFREFNDRILSSDQHGTPSWNTLVSDLAECIDCIKPDIIVTPHQQLDPHKDHYYSTTAVKQAIFKTVHKPTDVYFYANHLVSSDMFPFGPVHTLASLPPHTEGSIEMYSVVSVAMNMDKQRDKAAALAMMHDLQTPLRLKKKIRFRLQEWFIGRARSPYGADEYFRKAIRCNEIFYQLPIERFLEEQTINKKS